MSWSKKSRIQLAVAAVVCVTSIVGIVVAIGIWKATTDNQNAAVNSSGVNVLSFAPTQPPSRSPTLPATRVPSTSPAQTPAHDPTTQPTRSPIVPPTIAPTMFPSASPTALSARVEAPSAAPSESPTDSKVTTFYAIADTPYTQAEALELPIQVRTLPSDAEFLIHLGDIRSGRDGGACKLFEYTNVAATLRESEVPVFIVIGGKKEARGVWCSNFQCH